LFGPSAQDRTHNSPQVVQGFLSSILPFASGFFGCGCFLLDILRAVGVYFELRKDVVDCLFACLMPSL
jgi:hypothetical protein